MSGRADTLVGVTIQVPGRAPTFTELAAAVDAAGSHLQRLEALRVLTVAVKAAVDAEGVAALAEGVPAAAVGRALGVSRQAARKRFAPSDDVGVEPVTPTKAAPPKVWGELRVGPGRGVRAGRIIRRT